MTKTYRPYEPNQQLLLPAALQEWLPPDHLAYFISGIVDELDLSSRDRMRRKLRTKRGRQRYGLRM